MLKGFAKLLFAVVLILVSAGLIIQMKYSISFNEYQQSRFCCLRLSLLCFTL